MRAESLVGSFLSTGSRSSGTARALLTEPLPAVEEFSPEWYRWLVLAVLVWLAFTYNMAWMTFSASPDPLRELFPTVHIGDGEIFLLLNWGNFCYLVAAWPFQLHLQKGPKAIYSSVLVCAILVLLGCCVRILPVLNLPDILTHLFLHLGQILIGLAGFAACGVAPIFAAAWFPPSQRTLATSLIWTGQSAAPSLGFLAALLAPGAAGLQLIMIIEAISSGLVVLAWAFVPKLPRRPPSASAAMALLADKPEEDDPDLLELISNASEVHRRGLAGGLCKVLLKRRFLLLTFYSALSIGTFQCWSSSLSEIIDIGGDNSSTILGLASNAASFVGTMMAPYLADGCFRHRYKLTLVSSAVCQTLLLSAFACTLRGKTSDFFPLIHVSQSAVIAALCVSSVLNGLTGPLVFELGAEITFPAVESWSSSAISVMQNLGGIILLLTLSIGGDSLQGPYGSFLMAGSVALALLSLLPVEEAYPRTELDAETAVHIANVKAEKDGTGAQELPET